MKNLTPERREELAITRKIGYNDSACAVNPRDNRTGLPGGDA